MTNEEREDWILQGLGLRIRLEAKSKKLWLQNKELQLMSYKLVSRDELESIESLCQDFESFSFNLVRLLEVIDLN